MTDELKIQFESLMNAIEYHYSESEIQRQLGMLYLLYTQDKQSGKYVSVL